MTLSARIRRLPTALLVCAAAATLVAGGVAAAAPASADTGDFACSYFLSEGQSLVSGQILLSTFDQYRLTMQSDGNLVETGNGRVIWSTKTSGTGNTLTLRTDGDLVVISSTGAVLWSTHTSGSGLELTIGTSSEIDLDGQDGTPWHTSTAGSTSAVEGDVMTPQQSLGDIIATLTLESNGNLVDNREGHVLWQSKTAGDWGDSLHVQSDGNVVLYSKVGKVLWNTHTSGSGNVLSIGSNGVVEVTHGTKVLWHVG